MDATKQDKINFGLLREKVLKVRVNLSRPQKREAVHPLVPIARGHLGMSVCMSACVYTHVRLFVCL